MVKNDFICDILFYIELEHLFCTQKSRNFVIYTYGLWQRGTSRKDKVTLAQRVVLADLSNDFVNMVAHHG